jgi:hypothetical protein
MVSLSLSTKFTGKLTQSRYAKVPFGDPKELDRAQKTVVQLLNDAFDTCPRSGDEDLPINEAALRAACIFDFLNRAVDESGRKLPRELVAPNMLPGENISQSILVKTRGYADAISCTQLLERVSLRRHVCCHG